MTTGERVPMTFLRRFLPALLLGAAILAGCAGKSMDTDGKAACACTAEGGKCTCTDCACPHCTASREQAAKGPADMTGMLRIAWTLQSQEDVLGFNVYRGATTEGPWEKANEKPIPGDDTTMFERKYDFFDTGLEMGREYHYYVEEITFSGTTSKITPVLSSKAKARQYYVDKGYNPPEG